MSDAAAPFWPQYPARDAEAAGPIAPPTDESVVRFAPVEAPPAEAIVEPVEVSEPVLSAEAGDRIEEPDAEAIEAGNVAEADGEAEAPDRPVLSDESIELVLSNFRDWLGALRDLPEEADTGDALDLQTLFEHFTALRQEVNLQTKATRGAVEQAADSLGTLKKAVGGIEDRAKIVDDAMKPLLKAVVDVYDNLTIAMRQVEKQRDAIERPLTELTSLPEPEAVEAPPAPPPPPPRGFFARLFGGPTPEAVPTPIPPAAPGPRPPVESAALVRSSFDGLVAGYRMSINRLDRVLTQFGLESIPAQGEPFDPELMEVVEVAADSGAPAGQVLEEVRRGYRKNGVVFRFAQVRVAR